MVPPQTALDEDGVVEYEEEEAGKQGDYDDNVWGYVVAGIGGGRWWWRWWWDEVEFWVGKTVIGAIWVTDIWTV